jgi:hypothetical protein
MNDKLTQSARIRRSSKFTTDDSGRTVLVDEMVEPAADEPVEKRFDPYINT